MGPSAESANASRHEPVATAEAQLLRTDGSVGAAIVDYADSHPSRLVVIGTRGLSGVRSALTGSVTQHVTQNVHVPAHTEGNVLAPEASDLRDPQACICGQQHQRMITPSSPGSLIRSRQQRLHLFAREKIDPRRGEPFALHREHPLDLRGVYGRLVSGVTEERADRCKPQIPSAGADAPGLFQIVQESADERGFNVLERQPIRRLAQMSVGKLEQQLEGVAIGTDGMWAHVPLLHQTFDKELLQ